MSTMLAKLKFVTATKPSTYSAAPTNETRRAKLVSAIKEQINLINGEINGKPCITQVTKKDKAGVVTTSDKKIKKWYWPDPVTGAVLSEIHYGSTTLKLDGDKSAFKVASLAAMVNSLNLVLTAVEAGEIDTLIAAAAIKRSKKAK